MSYSAVLKVQNMWKCDYKLLKAQKETVNRSHHENAVDWNPLLKWLKWDVVEQDGFCLHFHQPHSSKYFHKYTSRIQ